MKVTKEIQNMETEINNVETAVKKKSKKARKNSNTVAENFEDMDLKRKSDQIPSEEEPVLKKKKGNKKNKVANKNVIGESKQPESETNGDVSMEVTSPKKGKKSKKQKANETQEIKGNLGKRKLDESIEKETLSKKEKKKSKKQIANSGSNDDNNSEKEELFTINDIKIIASTNGNDVTFNVDFADNDYMTKFKDLFVKTEAVSDLKIYRKSLKSQGLSKQEMEEKLAQKENVSHGVMMVELFKNLLDECQSSNKDYLITPLKNNIKEIESKFSSQDSETSDEDEDEDEPETGFDSLGKDNSQVGNPQNGEKSEEEGLDTIFCFKCQKTGHYAKDCFKNKQNFGQKTCDVCGSGDHLRRDCPDKQDQKMSCFNCNEVGHISRECPNKRSSQRDNSNSECRNCNESGHVSYNCDNLCTLCSNDDGHKRKDCPIGSGCRNCHENGHKSFECENECKLCSNNDGHMRKDCPRGAGRRQSRGGGGGNRSFSSNRGSNINCFNCNKSGHISRECPGSGQGRGSNMNCFNCNKSGHISRECPESGQRRGSNMNCFNCNKSGHISRECPESGQGRGRFGGRGGRGGRFGGSSGLTCFSCNKVGHMSRDCPQKGPGGRGRGGDSVNFMPIGNKSGFGDKFSDKNGQNSKKTFDDDD